MTATRRKTAAPSTRRTPSARPSAKVERRKPVKRAGNVPADPWQAFAYLVSRCAEGFGRELIEAGRTPTQARNAVVGCFLHIAAGEACRIAHDEGRKPDPKKWRKATAEAFSRARSRVNGRKSGAASPNARPLPNTAAEEKKE